MTTRAMTRIEYAANGPELVVSMVARPDVKSIGWRELMESLGDPAARVRVIHNSKIVFEGPLGELPVFEPCKLGAGVILRAGDRLVAEVPEGWGVTFQRITTREEATALAREIFLVAARFDSWPCLKDRGGER